MSIPNKYRADIVKERGKGGLKAVLFSAGIAPAVSSRGEDVRIQLVTVTSPGQQGADWRRVPPPHPVEADNAKRWRTLWPEPRQATGKSGRTNKRHTQLILPSARATRNYTIHWPQHTRSKS